MDDNLQRYSRTLYSAGDVAQRLNISVNMLRRYAKALEALEGAGVIKMDGQRGRLYTEEQVEALVQAREFVRASPGTSVEDALRAVLGLEGVTVKSPPAAPSEAVLRAAVEAAIQATLTEAVRPLQEQIGKLERQVQQLNRQLESPAPNSAAVRRAAEAEQINGYLLGELQRRRLEADNEQRPKPWWRFWA